MSVKLNNSDSFELVVIYPTEADHPVLFANKVQCLVNSGMPKEDAEEFTREIFARGVEIEMYYEVDYGFFGVEPDAVEAGTIYSPYSREPADAPDQF